MLKLLIHFKITFSWGLKYGGNKKYLDILEDSLPKSKNAKVSSYKILINWRNFAKSGNSFSDHDTNT